MSNTSKYPNTYYRVTVKGIIRDERGYVLAVKEGTNNWSLPGGGVDHGESMERALAREMYEEANNAVVYLSTGRDRFIFCNRERGVSIVDRL